MTNKTKVLWTIDAFTEDKDLHKICTKAVKAWVKGTDAIVEPVFVMSPDQMKLPPEFFANHKGKVEESAQKNLKALLKSTGIPGLQNPTYLESPSYSLQNAVRTLLDYAKQNGADLIVVTTQSRKGVSRFLFGSFAETLVLQSNIPVLLVSPKMRPLSSFKKILYTTDLSDKCRKNFPAVLDLAKQHGMSLVLYNKVEYFSYYTQTNFGAAVTYDKFLSDDIKSREEVLSMLASEARKKGVRVETIVDKNPKTFPASDAILKTARKVKADLIVMSAQASSVQAAILGSITRQVLRDSQCPVWVLHSTNQSEKSKKEFAPLKLSKGVANA